MSWTNLRKRFQNLKPENGEIKSDPDRRYNCAAFVLNDRLRWYDHVPGPGKYWPSNIPRNSRVDTYVLMFQSFGFETTESSEDESDYEKIVVYEDGSGNFKHVAKRTPSGAWVSKLGGLEDIEHSTTDVLAEYGSVSRILRRRRNP